MSPQEIYESKKRTIEEALQLIQSGQVIATGSYANEPGALLGNLHTIAHRVQDVHVWTGNEGKAYPYMAEAQYWDSFVYESFFYGFQARQIHHSHRLSYHPGQLHMVGETMAWYNPIDVYMGAVSPMDKEGYFYLSPSMQMEAEWCEAAKLRILEVNPLVPYIYGAQRVHISQVDAIVESTESLCQEKPLVITDEQRQVAEVAATLVKDGDTVQVGYGGTSSAVVFALEGKQDLGIHTELLSSPLGRLVEKGVVTNQRKTLHPGQAVCGFILGDQSFYDYMDHNPHFRLYRTSYVNDPHVIAQNDNMVAINTALQIDLTGQVCSESLGTRHFSGTGGASDFSEGAYKSKGGKGIIAITSTAKGGTISRISSILTPGSIVSISRNWVDYVVTEYGIAHLKFASVKERVDRLIAIAHPDFRAELRRDAEKYGLW